MTVNVLAVVSCLNCDGGLVSINVGRALAGRECSAILECIECGRQHHLCATLSQIRKEEDRHSDRRRDLVGV